MTRTNFRVVVYPRDAGDFGFGSITGCERKEDEAEALCKEIADQIRRHVDELPSSWKDSTRGVHVEWDEEA